MGIPVDPIKCFPSHPSEEILEEYVFRRLPETVASQVEEHLLICHHCLDAVEETERFKSALRVAARESSPASGLPARGWPKVLDFLPRLGSRASLAPVVVLALLAYLMIRPPLQDPPAPVAVNLASLRGSGPLSPAPAGKALQLSLEAPDLAPGKQYRAEVVDSSGGPVWKGAVTETDGKRIATMSKPLGKGVYWVRLYGANSEFLREFGMSVK
jgi:hypothetical protein